MPRSPNGKIMAHTLLGEGGGVQGFWKNVDSTLLFASTYTLDHLYFNNLHQKWPKHKIYTCKAKTKCRFYTSKM